VDLLWFGGIGTWVRADAEPDDDVDDRANAEERITASDLRARVIVEGGNLAMTRRARWQYASRGGRANLDSIDNAAGVTISDAEVNLKILLDDAVSDGTIDGEERNALLRDWTDDVVASVLGQVRRQAWSLGAEVARGSAIRPALAMVRQTCEADIDQALPGLDALDERVGLSRPQVAVLGSVVRRRLADRMLERHDFEPLLDADRAGRMLPPGARKRFADHVVRHPLRRELAATGLVNDLVNLLGPTGPWSLAMLASPNRRGDGAIDETTLDQALLALACAFETLDVHTRLLRIDEERDVLGADRRREAERLLELAVRATASVLLRGKPTAQDIPGDRRVLAAMWAALEADRPGTAGQQGKRETVRRHLADNLVHDELAGLLAAAPDLHVVPVLLRLARRTPDLDVPVALDIALQASAGLGLDRIAPVLDRHESAEDRWARAQVHGLRSDIEDARVAAAAAVLTDPAPPEEALAVFMAARREDIAAANEIIAEVEAIRPPRLDAIAVAVRVLRDASRPG
jgi:glutamate dehydrogenase